MGYGMYTLVLPFFAWMIVLVVRLSVLLTLFCLQQDIEWTDTLLQAVYSNAYITTKGILGPATSAMYANELNLFNFRIDLAAQKLVLATSNTTILSQRTQ